MGEIQVSLRLERDDAAVNLRQTSRLHHHNTHLLGSVRQRSYICSTYTELEPDRKESTFVESLRSPGPPHEALLAALVAVRIAGLNIAALRVDLPSLGSGEQERRRLAQQSRTSKVKLNVVQSLGIDLDLRVGRQLQAGMQQGARARLAHGAGTGSGLSR